MRVRPARSASISYIDCPTPTAAARCATRSTPGSARRTSAAIADVAVDGTRHRPASCGAAPAVHLLLEAVEHDDLVAALEQSPDEMRADEAGAAGDESAHAALTMRETIDPQAEGLPLSAIARLR